MSDLGRTGWAFFYWNARKTLYVLRHRRGQCPCHNPSDSGEPMRTGCEAVAGWVRPMRFQRVCPLLRRNEQGFWVCSVAPGAVRPFWLRALRGYATAIGLAAVVTVGLSFGTMRLIGYRVSVRQLVWPPAWRELRAVRADLFIEQARARYAAGQVRQAIDALSLAYEINPGNYQAGLMLAQFSQAGDPSQADFLYRRLLRDHPEHHNDTARVWFLSLLARGQLKGVAAVASREVADDPGQAAAWTNALIFATRLTHDPRPLQETLAQKGVPAGARTVIELARQVQTLPSVDARSLLIEAPPVVGFSYAWIYRVNTLIQLGYPVDALNLLAAVRQELTGRDVARLALAAYANLGDKSELRRDFSALLSPARPLQAPELTLLAVYLVNYPDPDLLKLVEGALGRVLVAPTDQGMEAAIAVFCAAGVQADRAGMQQVKELVTRIFSMDPVGLDRMQVFFTGQSEIRPIEALLPRLKPLSLELNYALLERYFPQVPAAGQEQVPPGGDRTKS
ncbi:MAG: tetratricopeptide repeat protein [Opitutales bacterium]